MKINGSGRIFLLILILLVTLTMLTTDRQIFKVESYSESVEEAVEIVAVQANKRIEWEAARRVELVNELARENSLLNQKIDLMKAQQRREREQVNKLLGIDGRYDANNVLVKREDLERFLKYRIYVKTTTVMEKPEPFKTENEPTITRESDSPATIVGRYVFMASHTNDPEEFSEFTIALATPFGMREKTYKMKILDHKVTIAAGGKDYDLIFKYRNKKNDFSLYELPEGIAAAKFPFAVGASSELKVGDFLYINGRPSMPFEVARPGYVSALETVPNFPNKPKDQEMEITQSSDAGDSGSPIIAFRDGNPELVGIYLGWWSENSDNGKNTRSRSLKIDAAVDEIKEKLGIDLRAIQREALLKN